MKNQSRSLVAPDGGWGWMVCLGATLISLTLRSLDQCFGLLYGDRLRDLNIDTTGASVILSTLDAVCSLSGIFVGPLIKRFTCRKVAVLGSLLGCTGLILSSQASSLTYLICIYSILGGLGTGLAFTSSFVSLNTYFRKRRTQVVALAMAGTSLGTMCMPQIVNFLLIQYDFGGAVLILGGLALHAIVGSLLCQPVSWHLVPAPNEKDLKLVSGNAVEESDAFLESKENDEDEKRRKLSIESASLVISSTDMINNHWKDEKTSELIRAPDENCKKNGDEQKANNSFAAKLVSFFDLNLLKDPIYVNLTLGLSLFFTSEMSFKLITPFFLMSIGMSKPDVAFALSLMAFSDVAAKLTMPTIFTICKFKNRNVFWIGIIFLGIIRSAMAESMPGKVLTTLIVLNGFFRGIVAANLNLTIAEYSTLEMLPSALGIMNVSRGLFVLMLGPILGHIRDTTGSYQICIHVMTIFIVLCSVMWGTEYLVKEIRRRRSTSEVSIKNPSPQNT